MLAGIYLADLVSGLLHWAFDTWFDEDITFVRRMVLQVREHHVYPKRIFDINFYHDAGTLSWIALILTGPAMAAAMSGLVPRAAGFVMVATAVTFSLLLVFMLESHKCGHRAKNPAARCAGCRACGILLSVRHHMPAPRRQPRLQLLHRQRLGRPHAGPAGPFPRPRMGDRALHRRAAAARRPRVAAPLRPQAAAAAEPAAVSLLRVSRQR